MHHLRNSAAGLTGAVAVVIAVGLRLFLTTAGAFAIAGVCSHNFGGSFIIWFWCVSVPAGLVALIHWFARGCKM